MVQYRVTNWSEYNRALIQRGSLTVWFSEEAARAWEYSGPRRPGGQVRYSDFAIETCLRLRLVYSLALRQTQGFVASLLTLLGLDLPVPDYSTLSRRHASLGVDLYATKQTDEAPDAPEAPEAPQQVVIDSTGLKVYGEGEWKTRKHGKHTRRTWRKLHLGVDPESGQITATTLTPNSNHDSSQVKPLLEETRQSRGPIGSVTGDGAYDTWDTYDVIEAYHATPVIPPQKNAKIRQHGNSKEPPLARDETLRAVRRRGRTRWKQESGYHRRSLAETAVWRFKRIVGRLLRTHTLANQKMEVRLGAQILNHMTALGMPTSVPAAR